MIIITIIKTVIMKIKIIKNKIIIINEATSTMGGGGRYVSTADT